MPNLSRRRVQTHVEHSDVTSHEIAPNGDEEIDIDIDSGTGEGGEEAQGPSLVLTTQTNVLLNKITEVEPEDVIFPPPGLKEISSLASWTVSTAKPGNGVAALRSPDTSQFWQSDGPQPHLLSIHFFKLVSIVHMRIYLDFESDESYTPTKIQFLAGMGVHDIQEFAEMTFEQPTGWIEVDFSNVGPILDDDEADDENGVNDGRDIDWSKRPVLRAFLVQVRILENHQNGKDTHLRAVQLFARDESREVRRGIPLVQTVPQTKYRLPRSRSKPQRSEPNNIQLASWMTEPDLR